MIINTTYVTDSVTAAEFIDYLRTFYIPKSIATGLLRNPRLSRIIKETDNNEGVSIALQFYSDSPTHYQAWLEERGEKLHRMMSNKFGYSMVGFSTCMEEIEL